MKSELDQTSMKEQEKTTGTGHLKERGDQAGLKSQRKFNMDGWRPWQQLDNIHMEKMIETMARSRQLDD